MDDVTAVKMNFRKEQWKQLILERQVLQLQIFVRTPKLQNVFGENCISILAKVAAASPEPS